MFNMGRQSILCRRWVEPINQLDFIINWGTVWMDTNVMSIRFLFDAKLPLAESPQFLAWIFIFPLSIFQGTSGCCWVVRIQYMTRAMCGSTTLSIDGDRWFCKPKKFQVLFQVTHDM